MSSNPRASSLMCGVCAVVLACDGPAHGPVAPDPASPAVSPVLNLAELGPFGDVEEGNALATAASDLLATGGKASGHADVHGTPVQNVRDERYSFTAVSTGAFPLAKGQVEVHILRFTGEELNVHAEVSCLAIVGNQAWIGSRITRFVVDGEKVPERVGTPMIFRVLDVGEGKGATDLASLRFFPPPGGDLAHCNTRPGFPILRESTIGNIQVKLD